MLVLFCPRGGAACLSVWYWRHWPAMFCLWDILEKLLHFQKPCSGMWPVGNYNKNTVVCLAVLFLRTSFDILFWFSRHGSYKNGSADEGQCPVMCGIIFQDGNSGDESYSRTHHSVLSFPCQRHWLELFKWHVTEAVLLPIGWKGRDRAPWPSCSKTLPDVIQTPFTRPWVL